VSGRTDSVLVGVVTGSRLLFAAAVGMLTPFSGTRTWAIVAASALVAMAEVSDLIDGRLARRCNAVSEFGKLFDPYADSLSRLTIYWSLAVIGRCLSPVPLLMAIRDVTVSYARMILVRQKRDASALWAGKAKAVVQGTCGLALMAGPLYWGPHAKVVVWTLSLLVCAVTLWSMLAYGLAALSPTR
jgi:CDP-diacylglycerol--glycerol-3-phosphate 3-phosphatidyltransferase